MKNFTKILIFSLFAITTYAQQATEIDSKSVKLPRYADLTAIQAAIPTAQQGMMVYNIGTASNWYFNGTAWANTAGVLAAPFIINSSTNGSTFSSTNTGFGLASRFENFSNDNPALLAIANGNNTLAGKFEYNNNLGSGTALHGTAVGFGNAISGSMDGNGYAATFITTEPTNTLTTFRAYHEGNGGAGSFTITKTTNAKPVLRLYTYGTGSLLVAHNDSPSNPSIQIRNDGLHGNALDIDGGIKVSGRKSAFKVIAYSTYIAGNKLGIQNSTMANASTDILIVTYEYTGGSYLNKQFATFWNGGNWEIHLTDGTAMPAGITFNVLVIKQ